MSDRTHIWENDPSNKRGQANDTLVLTKPNEIRVFQLLAVRGCIKLQAIGMRHSSGRNIKADWARHYGLSPRAKPEAVIAKLEEECRSLGWTPRPVGANRER